jgi:hypothetical protein
MSFTVFLGMLDVGGAFGRGFGGKNGIFSYFAAYESSQPGLLLVNAGDGRIGRPRQARREKTSPSPG